MFRSLMIICGLLNCAQWAEAASQCFNLDSTNSLNRILNNLNHPQSSRGSVIASPSQENPNYFFHWIRDAALTMGTLVDQLSHHPELSEDLQNWALFEQYDQSQALKFANLGEPKFMTNGEVFTGPWGRPQNDGPAIRALTFMRAFGVNNSVVTQDLDYVKKTWRDPGFDLWEEVKGDHFFTRFAQMRALQMASSLLIKQGQTSRAQAYGTEAALIEQSLSSFIDPGQGLVLTSLNSSRGPQKPSGLDISVILGVIYFGPSPQWSVAQNYILRTAWSLEKTFQRLYSINSNFSDMAPAIGRYPEDVYDGNGFSGGNPWFLATYGMAEFYCTLVETLNLQKSVQIDPVSLAFYQAASPTLNLSSRTNLNALNPDFWTLLQSLQTRGLSFIQRAQFHASDDGHLTEQFDRGTGFRRGAQDLTWSYASQIRAETRCQKTQELLAR